MDQSYFLKGSLKECIPNFLCKIEIGPTLICQTPVGRWPGAGRLPLQATVPGRFDPRRAGTAGFYIHDVRYATGAGMRRSGHRPAGGPGATPTFEPHPFPRDVCTELQTPQPHRAMPTLMLIYRPVAGMFPPVCLHWPITEKHNKCWNYYKPG